MELNSFVLARKPLECKSVAENVLKYGTGGINIDASRISYEEGYAPPKDANVHKESSFKTEDYNGDNPYILNEKLKTVQVYVEAGRFPANIILDEEAAKVMDSKSGTSKSSNAIRKNNQSKHTGKENGAVAYGKYNSIDTAGYKDEGGASRFFKIIK
jgi:site-specific DNA-methyltransferase (adenine-specific)